MRWLVLLCALTGMRGVGNPASDLQKIDEFNQLMQLRFQTTALAPPPGSYQAGTEHLLTDNPRALGMSRMAGPLSFGKFYLPNFNVTRDFEPENNSGKKPLAGLETAPLEVGLYLFGRAILDSTVDVRNYRALKGPAAVTEGAPRPKWYPSGENPAALADALPDWKAIYPLAQRAMKSFADGGAGFDTSMGTWRTSLCARWWRARIGALPATIRTRMAPAGLWCCIRRWVECCTHTGEGRRD